MEQVIRRALVSVYHKDGLAELLALLHAQGVELVSTGGTHSFIQQLGYPCRAVEDLTQWPEMLGGRVKTLHPTILGGILARREHQTDRQEVATHGLPLIDLVIVDLYPFEETVASGAQEAEIIEKIDIGGISLIRGAAKNFHDVVIIPSREDYATLTDILRERGAKTSLEERRHFARRAFAVSSHYDSAISRYFEGEDPSVLRLSAAPARPLRYGENPHQAGRFFGDLERYFHQLHGKELSYNNLQDIEAAVSLIQDFDEPTFAILKHNNACGCASRPTLFEAWVDALAGDPVSAFGGVLVTNRTIDLATAEEINKLFFEVLIAPDFAPEALPLLQSKKNRILLRQLAPVTSHWSYRSLLGGFLAQETDHAVETKQDMKPVTHVAPSPRELEDLVVATKLVKHSKSNAIVLCKHGQLIGSGVGQTSRVDALQAAIAKARHFGFDLHGAVLASDAFFPFDDCVRLAAEAGITALAQPGGSVRDADSISAANDLQVAMVMTGVRHFKH